MSTSSANSCPRCEQDTKLRDRSFSDQALTALLTWGELSSELVGKPLCDECYGELREVLIDRAEELTQGPAGDAGPKGKAKKPRPGKRAG